MTKEKLEHLMSLSKLALSDDEIEHFRQDLSAMLALIDVLKKESLDDIIFPEQDILRPSSSMRCDEKGRSLPKADILQLAEETNSIGYLVPGMMKADGE